MGTGVSVLSGLNPVNLFASSKKSVRLGGPVYDTTEDPDEWVQYCKKAGYRAAYCPVQPGADQYTVNAYRSAAKTNDIVISEVGAWSNMVSPDENERQGSIEKCINGLVLADQIGANCCVNVSGSRNPEHWAGPHQDNLTQDTFDLIVETTRKVIDAVNPSDTYFTLEAMPWAYPDSPENYLKLINAIQRKQFGVHIDPVNMVVSPQIYFRNGELIKSCFKLLGSYIRSCHAKDITIREDNYIPQLDELRPGLGKLNYQVYLSELAKLKDIPLMMEHLETEEEYFAAADYIRSVGKKINIEV
jgi:sugar phosphate isomerase/epimerase